jgi:hypothetical protein
MNARMMKGLLVLALLLAVGSAEAKKPALSVPVWVDATGKQVGPLGFSASIAQGVVLNLNGTWILVPFGVNGVGYDTWISSLGYGPGMLGTQAFFTTADCTGTPYVLATPQQLSSNSETNPIAGYMGTAQAIDYPSGTAELGTTLGIVATEMTISGGPYGSQVACSLPGSGGSGYTGPCLPAMAAPGEYFAPLKETSSPVGNTGGFTPPFSLVVP